MDIGVLYEFHSVVEGECANGRTDKLLVGLIGLVGEKDCIVVLTHSVVVLPHLDYSIFALFIKKCAKRRAAFCALLNHKELIFF